MADGGGEVVDGHQRAPATQRTERQRHRQARKLHERLHVAFDAGTVDEHRAQRHPRRFAAVEGPRDRVFSGELRAAIGVGRPGLVGLPDNGGRDGSGLRPHRRHQDEAPDPRGASGTRQRRRRPRIHHVIVLIGDAAGVGEAGEMDDVGRAREQWRPVDAASEIRELAPGDALGPCMPLRTARRRDHAPTRRRQSPHQMAADEARGPRDQHHVRHVYASPSTRPARLTSVKSKRRSALRRAAADGRKQVRPPDKAPHGGGKGGDIAHRDEAAAHFVVDGIAAARRVGGDHGPGGGEGLKHGRGMPSTCEG